MSTPVVMPQMGESIAEGTIVRWIKKVGDSVDRDEPLFEISTDKVDAEIPSPAAGVLLDIAVTEGETVPVNSVVATIGAAGEATAAAAAAAVAAPPPAATPTGSTEMPAAAVGQADAAPAAPTPDDRRQRSSPLVRRIAKEHGVDIGRITGTGAGGRVTKHDILEHLDQGSAAPASVASASPAATVAFVRPPASAALAAPSAASTRPVSPAPGPSAPVARLAGDRVEPMSVMRRKIAEHMVLSKHTSAHVYSVFEVNYTRVEQIRQREEGRLRAAGREADLHVVHRQGGRGLPAPPPGDQRVDRRDQRRLSATTVNLGIAVALDNGLIVPVVKSADEKNLLGLSRAIADVADRARTKKLNPEEVQGGTFTITNPGTFGAQFGLPVINQPQVAILGVGTIEKRAVVIDDMIGIRTMGYLTLGYDHRLVDGAVADQFMADLKRSLENFDPAQA